jgi:hypothetical protein
MAMLTASAVHIFENMHCAVNYIAHLVQVFALADLHMLDMQVLIELSVPLWHH